MKKTELIFFLSLDGYFLHYPVGAPDRAAVPASE